MNAKPHFKKTIATIVNFVASPLFRRIIFGWFLFQTAFLALSTKYGIPPDETYHFEFIKFYASHSLDPWFSNQDGYFFLGELTRVPSYLYHYLLSFPYRLISFFSGSDFTAVVWLRFINVAFGLSTLYALSKLAKKIKIPSLVTNLAMFMLANTLMFLFLAASINYDNLVAPLSIASFYLLVSLIQKFDPMKLIAWLTGLALATLVKQAFLPIAIMEGLWLMAVYRRQLLQVLAGSFRYLISKNYTLSKAAIVVVFVVATALFAERYGLNYFRHQSLSPACVRLHSVEDCRKHAIFRRNEDIKAAGMKPQFGIVKFVPNWAEAMKRKIYGIMGHRSTKDTLLIRYGAMAIWGLMLVAAVTRFRKKEKEVIALSVIGVIYVGLLLFINYRTFQRTGLYGLALQGRYAFPVLPVLYLVGSHYLLRLFSNSWAKSLLVAFVILIFITAGLPSYLYATNAGWYTELMYGINLKLHNWLTALF